MGHPSRRWPGSPNHLAQRGQAIKAGEFVFTGSVVETKWVNRAIGWRCEIEGLGEVEAVFE